MARKPATITQLNDYLAKTIKLDPILGNVYAIGQISDLKYHSAGTIYFSALDSNSKIRCMIPYTYAQYLEFTLENGQEVLLTGYIDLYKKGGSYSLIVKDIEINGVGKARLEFNMLLDKLKKEGLFDQEHKKPIPTFPRNIGIITAETGAALQDILKIIKSRNNYVNVYVFHAQVQGDNAPDHMIKALQLANSEYDFLDCLIIGRGGGSQEDLVPFNDEALARTIYDSEIPVISAVGHEIDFTICDFVADLRAETPTAAAQIAVPDITEIKEQMEKYCQNLHSAMNHKIQFYRLKAENLYNRLYSDINNKLKDYRAQLNTLKATIDENSPYEILDKGYSILVDQGGKAINSATKVHLNNDYYLILKDGKISLKVSEVIHGKE